MSTNSLVAYLNEDGSVVSSYVHYDGYATGVGEMLLEHYNSEERASDLAWCLGYASSLRETISESHEDRANTDEAIVHASFEEFEEYVRENSYLEYVYIWKNSKWMVGSSTLEEVGGVGRYAEYNSIWNGWEKLVTVYIREGNKTVARWKRMVAEGNLPHEYLDHANELDVIVSRYHRAAMAVVVDNVVSEWRESV